MGTRRHGQGGNYSPPPHENVVKCFCTLIAPVKGSVDELFVHYFYKIVGFWGFTPRLPPGLHPWTPLGTHSHTPSLPTPGKNPASANALYFYVVLRRQSLDFFV